MFFSGRTEGGRERRGGSVAGDNFQTLKMISGRNARGTRVEMARRKRAGSERAAEEGKSWCINTSYVSTLQSVMANRRLPLGPRRVKVASLTPVKATLGIYYAILLQGNCVFISGPAESEPQRPSLSLPFLSLLLVALHVPNASLSSVLPPQKSPPMFMKFSVHVHTFARKAREHGNISP